MRPFYKFVVEYAHNRPFVVPNGFADSDATTQPLEADGAAAGK